MVRTGGVRPTLASVVAAGTRRLSRAGGTSPEDDIEVIAAHILGLGREEVRRRMRDRVDAPAERAIDDAVERRAAGEPLQYITGIAYFRSLRLAVGPGVFVPRTETEDVTQLAIDVLAGSAAAPPLGIDLGTGCGAIALAMATEVPSALVFAVEVSPPAFEWTLRNFRSVGAPNARPVLADLAVALPDLDGSADVVIANPPYIPDDAVPREREVQLHAPPIALFGGVDGMAVVREISGAGRRLLRSGGSVVVEHGEAQAATVAALLRADGWAAPVTHRDRFGRDRATTAFRR